MKGFITGNFQLHFTAINYMKKYYGEKIAFEFAFLIHYQAWLIIPTILGIILFIYQLQLVARYNLQVAIDSSMNAAFGFFLTIGASLFIESWRKTQAIIKYMWALDAHIMQKNDERTEDFQFSLIYNDVTHRKEKKKVMPPALKLKLYNAGGIFALVAIILLTVFYFIANGIL